MTSRNSNDMAVQHRCATIERACGVSISFTETFCHPRHTYLPGHYYVVTVGEWDEDCGLEPEHMAWSRWGYMGALDDLAEALGLYEEHDSSISQTTEQSKDLVA